MAGPLPEPGTNRLLLGPLPDDGTTLPPLGRASTVDRSEPTLIVSTRRSPSEILDRYRTRLESVPAATDIISVSEPARSSPTGPDTTDDHGGRIRTVESANLSALGVAISDFLSRRTRDRPVSVWFESLTSLLRLVDLEDVFRFLHITTTRVAQAAAVATYHVDPAAHEPETINTLAYLFDDVIDVIDANECECEPIR